MDESKASDGKLRAGAGPGGAIYAIAMVDALSVGLILPALPHLVEGLAQPAGRSSATWIALLAGAWGATQFLFAPLVGAMSDRFGRRPVLLVALAGLAADGVLMALAPSLPWLLFGRALNGALAASIAACNAYVLDLSASEARAQRLGRLGAAWTAGFICGPALGGLLADVHVRLPFVACAVAALGICLYAWRRLPESLARGDRASTIRWSQTFPVRGMGVFIQPGLRRPALIFLLASLADQALPAFFALYVLQRYGWSSSAAGLTLAGLGVARMLVQVFAVRPLLRRAGEHGALTFGLLSIAAGLLVFSLAPSGPIFGLGLMFYALGVVAAPMLTVGLASRVAASDLGRLQGASTALQGAVGFVAPLMFGAAFAASGGAEGPLAHGGGALLLGAAIAGAAAWLNVARPR